MKQQEKLIMKIFKVAKIIDSTTLYITGGQADGIKEGDKFTIRSKEGIEIKDPDSGKVLETVPGATKATVYAANVFERVTMVKPQSTSPKLTFPISQTNILDVNPLQITGTSPIYSSSIDIGDTVLKN